MSSSRKYAVNTRGRPFQPGNPGKPKRGRATTCHAPLDPTLSDRSNPDFHKLPDGAPQPSRAPRALGVGVGRVELLDEGADRPAVVVAGAGGEGRPVGRGWRLRQLGQALAACPS